MPKRWTLLPPAPNELIFDLIEYPPFLVQILYNRGLRTAADVAAFLSPDACQLADPFALPDMEAAVLRIEQAVVGGEHITVYGDFDVDGICGAALLVQVLRGLGAQAEVYIPHRVVEGYGLNKGAIAHLREKGTRLIITTDCGTSSTEDIAHAHRLGVDVIVTDHHDVHGPLPPALAVVNPRRPDSRYPFADLAGVGVAYKLAAALVARMGASTPVTDMLDLVAMGTVIDVAPLVGENRALVQRGLERLRTAPRPGLQALLEQARIPANLVDTGNLSFALGPRLNAAGRIDTARTSYELLQCTTLEAARPLAQKLEEQNQERQKLLESALASARAEAAEQVRESPLIFVAHKDYPAGVIGLIANRLVEEFYRPAAAVEEGTLFSRGSCRSIPGFHVARALDECADLLERHGGHAQAAGFTVRTDRIADLRNRLTAVVRRELGDQEPQPEIEVDCVIPLGLASWESLRWLRCLEPFGVGNPQPVFQSNNVEVASASLVGNNHLRLRLREGRVTWDAIAFRQGALATELRPGDRIDLLYNLEQNSWNGEETLRLVVKDLRRS